MKATRGVERRRQRVHGSSDHRPNTTGILAGGVPAVTVAPTGVRRERAVMSLLLLFAVAVASWFALSDPQHAGGLLARLLLPVPVAVLALLLARRASAQLSLDLGTRRFWRIMMLAIALAPAEQLALGMPVAVGETWAELLLVGTALASPLATFGALMQLPPAPRSAVDRLKLFLDMATVAVGGLLLAWFTITTTEGLTATPTRLWFVLQQLQGVLDLLLVLVASIVWRRTVLEHHANTLVLVGAALLANFLGHTASVAQMLDGTPRPDVTHMVTPLSVSLLAAAAWVSAVGGIPHDTRRPRERRVTTSSLLPYAATLPGFALLLKVALEQATQPMIGLVFGAVLLTVLAFARQIVSSREAVMALAEAAARENEARFQALVQHSSDVIMIVDPDGTIRFASPSMTTVFGHDPAKLLGTNLTQLLHPDDLDVGVCFLEELAGSTRRTGDPTQGTLKREWRLRNANGDWMTVDNVGTNLLREPVVGGLVLNTRDVTEQSVIKQQYMHQAFHDPLTDLANRSLFLYQVGHALARHARLGQPVTVLFLDLDNFKTVNDSLGHAEGDRLLVEAARRLAVCARTSDLIARLGGDEFAVLLEAAESEDDVLVFANRIGEALSRPFILAGKEVFVNASIGIARSVRGEGSDELVRNADVAMYVAKTRGKGQHVLFEPQMHQDALERLVVEADLRRA
ncbi:diguanylate cyclase domain-containing protein, partial [Gemmatimonas sp.]|uniref:diguanylate cyclase domain-containing protein n=1 Tax=Gemmatimonas sp. TaxID=1962908 RepID=UPI00391D41DC